MNNDFTIPDFVSEECADLIRNILVTDPLKRLTLQEIKQHCWLKQIKAKEYYGIMVACNPIPYDDDIIYSVLSKFNITYQDAKTEVLMNRHTAFTTAYYLTLKLFLRQGG